MGELLIRATLTNRMVACQGGYPDAPPGGYAFSLPTGAAQRAAAGWGALTRAGTSLAALFAPRVAYAVEGGVGGEQFGLNSDGIVAVEVPAAPAAAAH